MNWKYFGYAAAILALLVVLGGLGIVITRPTTNTVVGRGGKAITINTDNSTPLLGCSFWKVGLRATWQKGFNLQPSKEDDKK